MEGLEPVTPVMAAHTGVVAVVMEVAEPQLLVAEVAWFMETISQ
jgi:hypothetical protein